MPDGVKTTHPSFALLSFSRTTRGKGVPLFGSSIEHGDTIRMKVKPAKVERSLNHDWIYEDGREYLEVEMSYSQFAEAITSMNMGSGVPVTLRYLDGKQIENPEIVNKRLQFEEEVRDRMKALSNKMKKLTENAEEILNNKKSINKGDKQIILSQLAMLRQEVHANLPYVMGMFNEQMDKTVMEAKGEIEAFTLNKIHSLGLNKLEDLKQLALEVR